MTASRLYSAFATRLTELFSRGDHCDFSGKICDFDDGTVCRWMVLHETRIRHCHTAAVLTLKRKRYDIENRMRSVETGGNSCLGQIYLGNVAHTRCRFGSDVLTRRSGRLNVAYRWYSKTKIYTVNRRFPSPYGARQEKGCSDVLGKTMDFFIHYVKPKQLLP